MTRRAIGVLAVLGIVLLVLLPPAWAQEGAGSPSPAASPSPSPSPSPEPSPSPSPLVVPLEYRSARATLETFVSALKESPLRPTRQALACLDLSSAPAAIRDTGGVLAAVRLFEILQAIGPIEMESVPAEPEGAPFTLYRQPSGTGIVLARGADGSWRFSAETVEDIYTMYEALVAKGRLTQTITPWLDVRVLGLYGWQWVALVCLPLLGYLGGRLAASAAGFVLRTKISEEAREVRRRALVPACWLLGSLLLWTGLRWLDLPVEHLVLFTLAAKLAAAVTAVLTSFFLIDVVAFRALEWPAFAQPRYRSLLLPLTTRSLKLVVSFLGLIFVLQNLDVNVWSLFAGVSVVGAMVALAGQDLMKNLFGSVTVVMDRPFDVGDWIVVAGAEGTVEEVGFRSTRVRTFHDSLVTLPNSILVTALVENYGARRYRRYTQQLNLALETPPDRIEAFCEGIREILRRNPAARKESFQVWVNDVSPYSLKVLLYVFWECPDWTAELRERHRFLVDVVGLAHSLGVELVKPSSAVEVHQRREDA